MKEFVFEVETTYLSGKRRMEYICADSEKEMWSIYDKHHNSGKIKDSVIADSWRQ